MRIRLDTHAFPWFATGDQRLPAPALEIIQDPASNVFVSVASCWEIAIKNSIGRLDLRISLDQLFNDEIEDNGLVLLEIERLHVLEIPKLGAAHGDPFDHLLVAQAKFEKLVLLSSDRALDGYEIDRIWPPHNLKIQ